MQEGSGFFEGQSLSPGVRPHLTLGMTILNLGVLMTCFCKAISNALGRCKHAGPGLTRTFVRRPPTEGGKDLPPCLCICNDRDYEEMADDGSLAGLGCCTGGKHRQDSRGIRHRLL